MTDDLVEKLDEFRLEFEEFRDKWEEKDIFGLFAKFADRLELLEIAMAEIFTETEETSPSIAVIHGIARVALKEKKDD